MANNKLLRLHSFPEHNTPPFARDLVAQISPGKAAKMGITAPKGDASTLFIATTEIKDNKHFVKVFNDNLEEMLNLSKSDTKVLSYAWNSSRLGNDKIIVPVKDCMKKTILSDSAVRKSIVKLISRNILARTNTTNLYWINPTMFFKGDRIVLVNEYIRADRAQAHGSLPSKQISALQAASPLYQEPVIIPKALSKE